MLTLPWTQSEPECETGRPASLEVRELRTKPLHFCGMKVPKGKAVMTKALYRTHEAWPCGAILTRAQLGESPRSLRARLSPPCSSARAKRSRGPRRGLVCSLGVHPHSHGLPAHQGPHTESSDSLIQARSSTCKDCFYAHCSLELLVFHTANHLNRLPHQTAEPLRSNSSRLRRAFTP